MFLRIREPEASHLSRDARKLLTRRLQRAMAERMDAAPRQELLKNLTQEYRKRFATEREGGTVGSCTIEQFDEIVESFIGLGARELEIRVEGEWERPGQEDTRDLSEMMSAGGSWIGRARGREQICMSRRQRRRKAVVE